MHGRRTLFVGAVSTLRVTGFDGSSWGAVRIRRRGIAGGGVVVAGKVGRAGYPAWSSWHQAYSASYIGDSSSIFR